MKETLLHPVVGPDDLENIPSELLVQLPAEEAHQRGGESDDNGDSDEVRSNIGEYGHSKVSPLKSILFFQNSECSENLIDLDSCAHHESQVGEAHANGLDSVLHAQSVPDNDKLIKESEDEECEEGRNDLKLGSNGRVRDNVRPHAALESAEDVSSGYKSTCSWEASRLGTYASKLRQMTAWRKVMAMKTAGHLLLIKAK